MNSYNETVKTLTERVLSRLPPPAFLTMPAVGLALSDRSVQWVELCPKGRGFVVGTWGELPLPEGALEGGQVKDASKLIETLSLARVQGGLDRVIVALPEEHSYTVTMKLPKVALHELRESILFSLDQYVPLAPSETVFDYAIAYAPRKGDEHHEVIVSAVALPLVREYEAAFAQAGLTVLAFEIETQSLARATGPLHEPLVAMVVDIGELRTSMAIVRNGDVWFSSTAQFSGPKGAKTGSESESQQVKSTPLSTLYGPLVEELRKHIDYWNMNGRLRVDDVGRRLTGEEGKVTMLVVCGGEANVPGLVQYLGGELGLPAEAANPWRNVLSFDETIPPISRADALRFATAIGLALRPIVPRITP